MYKTSATSLLKTNVSAVCKRSFTTRNYLSVSHNLARSAILPRSSSSSSFQTTPGLATTYTTKGTTTFYRTNSTTASANSNASEPAPNSTSSSSSKSPRRGVSTLGAEAPDTTTITNPFKTENGTLLAVKVSQRAAQKLNAINKADNKPDQILRVLVESGGCHGYQYVLGLKPGNTIEAEEDSIFERDGARVVIDHASLEILRDSTVDYTTELIGSQFKIVDSPHTSSACGCGSSFSIDPASLAT